MKHLNNLAFALFLPAFWGCGPAPADSPSPDVDVDAGADSGVPAACAEDLVGETLRLTSHATIQPGEDVSYCRRYTTPEPLEISQFVGTLGPAGHHALMLVRPSATEPDGLGPCSEVELMDAKDGQVFQLLGGVSYETDGVPFVFPSSPVQVGLRVPAGAQLVLDGHFLNAGAKPVEACATMALSRAKSVTVALEFRTVLPKAQYDMVIPAHQTIDVIYDDEPMASRYRIVAASSHMHAGGKHFRMSIAETGQTVYETDVWAEPAPAIYDKTVLVIEKGQTLRLECTFENTGSSEQRFPDQMCVGAMYVMPW